MQPKLYLFHLKKYLKFAHNFETMQKQDNEKHKMTNKKNSSQI